MARRFQYRLPDGNPINRSGRDRVIVFADVTDFESEIGKPFPYIYFSLEIHSIIIQDGSVFKIFGVFSIITPLITCIYCFEI